MKTETKKVTRTRKTAKTIEAPKKAPKTVAENDKKKISSKKDNGFSFGGMTKEERRALIEEAIGSPKKERPSMDFKVEDSEYTPSQWVVVLTPKGDIYQEPVPRYADAQYFIYILASVPDSPIIGNKIDFSAEIYKTSFTVKGVDCVINTVNFEGTRKENAYVCAFELKNGTTKIGGNLVFSKDNSGFSKKEAEKVVAEIVKKLNNYKEVVE